MNKEKILSAHGLTESVDRDLEIAIREATLAVNAKHWTSSARSIPDDVEHARDWLLLSWDKADDEVGTVKVVKHPATDETMERFLRKVRGEE